MNHSAIECISQTTLSVSHHTITALNTDNILVLNSEGQIDQSGVYEEVVEAEGIFATLVQVGDQSEYV
jgi:ABC-type transport system involved in cytochrome bd biosynthesis fused ATPase/permease subunit